MTTDDELGRRIRRLAEAMPVRAHEPPSAATAVAPRSAPHVVRRVVLAVSAITIVAVAVAVIAGRNGSSRSRIGSVPPSELATTTAPVATTPRSTVVETTESPPPTVAASTAAPPPAIDSVTEPVIDLEGCAPTWGRSYPQGTYTINSMFARPSTLPIAYQVFGDPSGSLAEPFAILLRFFADQRLNEVAAGSTGDVDINGSRGVLLWHPNIGRGTLHWLLPDGSEAYLRSDSLDGDELLGLARSLVARPASAAVPGFDLADDHGADVALLDEQFGPFPSAATTASECVADDGSYVRVSVITPGIVAAAAAILDRGIPPRIALRQLDDGRLLMATGTPSAAASIAAAIDHVRQATAAEWAQMLEYPAGSEMVPTGLPIDADAQYRLATRTYATPQDMADALIAILQQRAPEADAGDAAFTTYMLYDTPFPSIVVSKTELDDSVVASRWLVMYLQDSADQYSVFEVHQALVCRDRTVVPADTGVCP
jgi:hypothetical protein